MKDDLKSVAEAFGIDGSTGQDPVDEISQAAQYQALIVFEREFNTLAKQITKGVSELANDQNDLYGEIKRAGFFEPNPSKKNDQKNLAKFLDDMYSIAMYLRQKAVVVENDIKKISQVAKNYKRVIGESTGVAESMSRHCEFYKAKDGKWYIEKAKKEVGK
jgi:hypothetical protein